MDKFKCAIISDKHSAQKLFVNFTKTSHIRKYYIFYLKIFVHVHSFMFSNSIFLLHIELFYNHKF